jgi:hypothetical protein
MHALKKKFAVFADLSNISLFLVNNELTNAENGKASFYSTSG